MAFCNIIYEMPLHVAGLLRADILTCRHIWLRSGLRSQDKLFKTNVVTSEANCMECHTTHELLEAYFMHQIC